MLCSLNQEEGTTPFEQLANPSHPSSATSVPVADTGFRPHASAWVRLPGQSCQIPNRLSKVLHPGQQGCSALAFSPDGR